MDAVRKAMRRLAVLDATGWSDATLDRKIKEGKFPKGIKIDPTSRSLVWFADEVAAFQKAAVDAAAMEAA